MTRNQARFCEEYIIDLNGTRAYMTAYPHVKSESTARANASRLLTNANIQNRVAELMQQRSERTGITADEVLRELQHIAMTKTEITGKEKLKALELLGKHLGLFSSGSDNSAALDKLDEVLGQIKDGF